jgi:hypothetical protein
MPKQITNVSGAGSAAPIRPMPTTEDLARSIQALDATLSEVLVLLYHVVHVNHSLVEGLREQRPAAAAAVARLGELRHLYAVPSPVLSERSTGQ